MPCPQSCTKIIAEQQLRSIPKSNHQLDALELGHLPGESAAPINLALHIADHGIRERSQVETDGYVSALLFGAHVASVLSVMSPNYKRDIDSHIINCMNI